MKKSKRIKILEKQVAELLDWQIDIQKPVENEVVQKPEPIIGKWYKTGENLNNQKGLVCYQGNHSNTYGFNKKGVWTDYYFPMFHDWTNPVPATEQEVTEALNAEAKRRGLVEGTHFNSLDDSEERGLNCVIADDDYYIEDNCLHCTTHKSTWGKNYSNPILFKDGIWATPITSTITRAEVLEKYGMVVVD